MRFRARTKEDTSFTPTLCWFFIAVIIGVLWGVAQVTYLNRLNLAQKEMNVLEQRQKEIITEQTRLRSSLSAACNSEKLLSHIETFKLNMRPAANNQITVVRNNNINKLNPERVSSYVAN